MYPNPGFCPVSEARGNTREEEGATALFSHREGRRRTRCMRPRGYAPVFEGRGGIREEEDATARFQHQGREEESPDVSASGRLRPV